MLCRQRRLQLQLLSPPCSPQQPQQLKSLRGQAMASQMDLSLLLRCKPLQRLRLSIAVTPVSQQLCIQGPLQQLRPCPAWASVLSQRCRNRPQALPLQLRPQWNQGQRQHLHQMIQQAAPSAQLTQSQPQTQPRQQSCLLNQGSASQMSYHPQLQPVKHHLRPRRLLFSQVPHAPVQEILCMISVMRAWQLHPMCRQQDSWRLSQC